MAAKFSAAVKRADKKPAAQRTLISPAVVSEISAETLTGSNTLRATHKLGVRRNTVERH